MNELEEEYDEEYRYYENIALCLSCANYDGDNRCAEYHGMPKEFFGRKNKCKHYSGIGGITNID